MFKKAHAQITIFALVLSLVAVILSGVSLSKAGEANLDDAEFMIKVEKGIEEYIKKQRVAQAGGEAANANEPVDVSLDDDAMKGDKDAPVTIVEFSDFECPFCSRFYKGALPELISKYVDTGKVKFVYRDFPLSFHANSKIASMAAECAKDQGGDKAYYLYHNKLYENQQSFGIESFKKWAGEQGLNQAKFDKCLDDEKFKDEVEKDFAEGQSYGVTGTPAFFINGRKISGAQPFSVFETIVEEELAK